jgi:exonuclease VII small subunit
METLRAQFVEKAEVWRAYRDSFEDFAKQVRRVQGLIAHPHRNREAIEAALLELERARRLYNQCRDLLADQLLRSSAGQIHLPAPDASQTDAGRVRSIAELLWEVSGRPDGTAEEDWYRAEEILRRATAA